MRVFTYRETPLPMLVYYTRLGIDSRLFPLCDLSGELDSDSSQQFIRKSSFRPLRRLRRVSGSLLGECCRAGEERNREEWLEWRDFRWSGRLWGGCRCWICRGEKRNMVRARPFESR